MPSRRTLQPKGGAGYVNAHVRILCGGPGETRVPTAMFDSNPQGGKEKGRIRKAGPIVRPGGTLQGRL